MVLETTGLSLGLFELTKPPGSVPVTGKPHALSHSCQDPGNPYSLPGLGTSHWVTTFATEVPDPCDPLWVSNALFLIAVNQRHLLRSVSSHYQLQALCHCHLHGLPASVWGR